MKTKKTAAVQSTSARVKTIWMPEIDKHRLTAEQKKKLRRGGAAVLAAELVWAYHMRVDDYLLMLIEDGTGFLPDAAEVRRRVRGIRAGVPNV
ncbi:hypothetical protein AYO44_06930 [Planctomycetaceae bacterium SCGC AG-212-F19]|nr:hypothetical protein AYO44_06930 [Planctomycetaceae bacterium SCGC AG-212-F19]